MQPSGYSSTITALPLRGGGAAFIGRDEATAGSFNGTYGRRRAGFWWPTTDPTRTWPRCRRGWPPWSRQRLDAAENCPWLAPPPAADPRALADPRDAAAPRKIGQFCTKILTPTFSVDVAAAEAAPGTTHQFAFYFVDFDFRGRRQTVQLMDGATLKDISPSVLVGPPGFSDGSCGYPRTLARCACASMGCAGTIACSAQLRFRRWPLAAVGLAQTCVG